MRSERFAILVTAFLEWLQSLEVVISKGKRNSELPFGVGKFIFHSLNMLPTNQEDVEK